MASNKVKHEDVFKKIWFKMTMKIKKKAANAKL